MNGTIPNSAVAIGNNRSNTSGIALPSVATRTSIFVTNVVQPGKVLPVPVTGTTFYVTVATSKIKIRPRNGIFNEYMAGTGLDLDLVNAFDLLEVKNENAFPVVFQIFVGFDRFIDKRLILTQTGQGAVAFPTAPTANSVAVINIEDKSGNLFTDINGNDFYALWREEFVIFNLDTGATILVQKADTVVANDLAIGAVYPVTAIRFPLSGNYRLNVGGGNINAIVHEVYQALPAL